MKDVKISDYLWFQEGPGVRNTQYTTSGVKLINVANLVDGNVDLSTSDRYISEEEAYGKYNHFLADDGDFVIASSGIKIDYFDKKMGFIKKEHLPLCMNTSCIRFKVLDTNNLEIKYFMYYLKSNSFKKQLFNQITGSAQLNFGPSHLKKMTFPLIELKEQKRIIERLDKTQNIINETKSLLSKYDTLIKSRFIEMFGDPVLNPKKWNIEKLKTLTSKIGSGATPKGGRESYISEGISLVRSMNVYNGYFEYDGLAHITEKQARELDNVMLQENDVLINITGASVARCCILPKDVLPARVNQHVSILRTTDKLHPVYLSNLLITDTEQRVLLGIGGAGGATREAITKTELETLDIPVPPLPLQNDFATFVHQIDKSKFAVQKSLEKAETLYKSLMQEYFG